jgi:hypothetical protein
MFVRFRQTPRKLQVSLIETKRVNGKVQHEHIASLGSIAANPTTTDRIEFFRKFEQRMTTLTNRVDEAQKNAITLAIGERIPLITPDDLKAVQVENAKAEANFWDVLKADQDARHTQQKAQIAKLKRTLPESRQVKALMDGQAKAAKTRLSKAKKGTLVGGLMKPDIIKMLGWKPSEIRHCVRVYEIHKMGADKELLDEIMKRHQSSERAAARAIIKRKMS